MIRISDIYAWYRNSHLTHVMLSLMDCVLVVLVTTDLLVKKHLSPLFFPVETYRTFIQGNLHLFPLLLSINLTTNAEIVYARTCRAESSVIIFSKI